MSSRYLTNLCFLFRNVNISKKCINPTISNRLPVNKFLGIYNNEFHTSCGRRDLMEFFDDQKNWGMKEVRVGRSWRKDELRIKSNTDLHKLWYILLKEKNMLLTMQHEYKLKFKAFPNPERLDKVEESMENLEEVVRERNRAYFELETGETGERPVGEGVNCFGLPYKYKMREHVLERKFNKSFLKEWKLYNYTEDHKYVRDFLFKLNEKKTRMHQRYLRPHSENYELNLESVNVKHFLEAFSLKTDFNTFVTAAESDSGGVSYFSSYPCSEHKTVKRNRYFHVCQILKRFPNVDEEALKAEFPDVDIEKARKDPKSRGNRVNPY